METTRKRSCGFLMELLEQYLVEERRQLIMDQGIAASKSSGVEIAFPPSVLVEMNRTLELSAVQSRAPEARAWPSTTVVGTKSRPRGSTARIAKRLRDGEITESANHDEDLVNESALHRRVCPKVDLDDPDRR